MLDQLDPASCLKHLKAIVSPHPYDLEPVEPVIQFQQAKYRFTDPVDALAGIDSRPDLLKMDWYRFENLIRQLFEAMGLEVRVTQSSRDEGINASRVQQDRHRAPSRDPNTRPSGTASASPPTTSAPWPDRLKKKRAHSRRPGHHGLGQRRNQGLRRP